MSSFHEALHEALLDNPAKVPAKATAAMIGKNYLTLLNELNPEQEYHKFGAHLVEGLIRATGDKRPVAALAEACGGIFVDLEGMDGGCCGLGLPGLADLSLKAMQSMGAKCEALRQAGMDGRIDRAEAREILRRADRVIADLIALKQTAQHQAE
jgi:hypothetical protein